MPIDVEGPTVGSAILGKFGLAWMRKVAEGEPESESVVFCFKLRP